MDDPQKIKQEKSVLRWGGLAGILGATLFIITFVVALAGPVGMEDPATLEGWVTRFPEIKTARILENGIYLAAATAVIPLFIALYRALRKNSLAPALIGSALGILGLVVFIVGALPHVAHTPLSDLYHAPGVTPEDQATIALMWQSTRGVFDAILYAGFFVEALSLIIIGAAMFGEPAFGKGFGSFSVVLGVVSFAAAVLQIIDPVSMIGAATFLICLIFYFVVGWKTFSLSRT